MTASARFSAGLELTLLFAVWALTVWVAWPWTGASIWTGVGFVSLAGVVIVAVAMRKPDWKNAGFRLDNLGSALLYVSLPILLLLGLFLLTIQLTGISCQLTGARKTIQTVLSGIVQQAFFLGYLFHRWNALVGNPIATVVANALSFALVHLPHIALTTLTAFGGIFLGALFLRARNVFALGLAHGLLAALLVPTLRCADIVETMQIGPPELLPLATEVARHLRPGNRIGIGPRGIDPVQVGYQFSVPVERIGDPFLEEPINRDRVLSFFMSTERVFCLLSEEDVERYLKPLLGKEIFLLGQRYVWKRQFRLNQDFLRQLFHGDGDIPVLAAVRQKFFLLSNRPPEHRPSHA